MANLAVYFRLDHYMLIVKSISSDLNKLVKFRLTFLVVFTSVLSYYVVGGSDHLTAFYLSLGGLLVTASANIFNQLLEIHEDGQRLRTKLRPLPSGRMLPSEAFILALLFGHAGIALLLVTVNLSASLLSLFSLLLYSFIYTPLKRRGVIAVFVGALPGALPILIGSVSVDGVIPVIGFLLFLLQVIWQFPHFWAINLLQRPDFERVGYYLLPALDGGKSKSLFVIFTSALLLVIAPLFFSLLGSIHILLSISLASSGVPMFLSCLLFFVHWVDLKKASRLLLFSSLFYLPLTLFITLYFTSAL